MTKAEKIQVKNIWAELENIVTVMDPSFNVQEYIKTLKSSGKDLETIQGLITFIRIASKYLMFEIEALQREGYTLLELVEELRNH